MPCSFAPCHIPCPVTGCSRFFTNWGGLCNHLWIHHHLPHSREQQRNNADALNDLPLVEDGDLPNNDPFLAMPPQTPEPENETSALETVKIHPFINGWYMHKPDWCISNFVSWYYMTGRPCDQQGNWGLHLHLGTIHLPMTGCPMQIRLPLNSQTCFIGGIRCLHHVLWT